MWFLHAGGMLLEEPLDELSGRLREVRVTREQPAVVPERMPKAWLQARAFGNVLTGPAARFAVAETLVVLTLAMALGVFGHAMFMLSSGTTF